MIRTWGSKNIYLFPATLPTENGIQPQESSSLQDCAEEIVMHRDQKHNLLFARHLEAAVNHSLTVEIPRMFDIYGEAQRPRGHLVRILLAYLELLTNAAASISMTGSNKNTALFRRPQICVKFGIFQEKQDNRGFFWGGGPGPPGGWARVTRGCFSFVWPRVYYRSENKYRQLFAIVSKTKPANVSTILKSWQTLQEDQPRRRIDFGFDQQNQELQSNWPQCDKHGYICALWQLFHHLTAECLNQNCSALPVIIDYVRYFYRASSNSLFLRQVHFNDPPMTSGNDMMWLWNTHNLISDTLYRNSMPQKTTCLISLPRHYPLHVECPVCFTHVEDTKQRYQYNETAIKRYLAKVYTRGSIITVDPV